MKARAALSRTGRRSLVSIGAIVIATSLVACRNKSDTATQIPQATARPTLTEAATEDASETEEPPEVVTIEVTRVVVETAVVVVTPEPVEQQPEPKELTICLKEEPETLYPYGLRQPSITADHVSHGIYESMFTTKSYDYQARGIEKIPSLSNGDVVFQNVTVNDGDLVVDADGDLVSLKEGVRVLNLADQEVVFDGTPLVMTQMVVQFALEPLIWSDGTPVSADDSVFSFEIASDPETPVPKNIIERTESYVATGDLTLEWTGIPGYFDRTYFTNIWSPYPRHYWGEFTPEELIDADVAIRRPLSSGPFVLTEWIEGEQITLEKNENYYLADQGLPNLDTVRFIFASSSSQLLANLLSGKCDIGTHEGISISDAPILLDAEQNGLIVPHYQTGTVFEHIDFGIDPVTEFVSERPDWFEDERVRRAFVHCTNREAMVEELLYGQSEIIHAYVPSSHPLYPDDISEWPYDPVAGNMLLDSAGYRDLDEDGFRDDPRTGSRFKVQLLSPLGNKLGEQVAYRFRDDLLRCGVEVLPAFLSSEEYFSDGPEGPLFGRKFDLGAFPWLISIEPNCALYLSSRIPGPDNAWNRSFNNETGFDNEAFDAACEGALAKIPGMPEYAENHREALRIWSEQVPIIPLFMRLKIAATRPDVENLIVDPTQPSELWNLYEIDVSS